MMRKVFNNKNELYIELALIINSKLYNDGIISAEQYKEAEESLLKKQLRKAN